jgi:hypothetical protein
VGDQHQILNDLEHGIRSEDLLPCYSVRLCPAPVCRGLVASIRKRASGGFDVVRRPRPRGGGPAGSVACAVVREVRSRGGGW